MAQQIKTYSNVTLEEYRADPKWQEIPKPWYLLDGVPDPSKVFEENATYCLFYPPISWFINARGDGTGIPNINDYMRMVHVTKTFKMAQVVDSGAQNQNANVLDTYSTMYKINNVSLTQNISMKVLLTAVHTTSLVLAIMGSGSTEPSSVQYNPVIFGKSVPYTPTEQHLSDFMLMFKYVG